jgi:UDP-N-acetylmuramate dehydrogenase
MTESKWAEGMGSSTLADVGAALEARLPGRVRRDVSSAELTTYRCGGQLAVFVRAEHEDDLGVVAEVLRPAGAPVLIVGRGSNLLVADAGFRGVAITLAGELEQLDIDRTSARVRAGGAVALPVLARRAAAVGVGGLEFFVGIPGSVGGAVRMNAGGHGADTADVIVSARVLDLDDGGFRDLRPAELGLGYRQSAVADRAVVLGASFAGRTDEPSACAERVDEIVRWRREHQPGGQNAGSVFTNPPGDAAGRLIEAAGCKGLRLGGAVVSEKHANFFVADPGASAADVYALIELVQRRVEESFGVRLEPELRCIGFGEGR